MKSRIFYASLIMMLLFSTAAFSEVLNDEDGCGDSASADASASGSTNYKEDSESGWYWEYTTVGGPCNWSYSICANADAEALLKLDKWASATAVGQAEISGAASDSAYVSSSVSGTGEYDGQYIDDPQDEDSDSNSGGACLSAYQGICIDVDALAVAEIEEGSDCWADAEAEAYGSVSLSEN